MKKSLLTLLGVGLLLTSCQSDEPFAPGEGGEKQVTFTLNVPGDLGTRAAAGANQSDKGGVTNMGTSDIQYTLVLDANGDKQILTNANAIVTGTTATFKPTVVLGRNYKITAYASLDGAWNGNDAIDITNNFNNEAKDDYFYTTTHNFADRDLSPLNLTRPFGKLRLVAEDYDPAKTKVEKVTITYNNPQQGTFDPTTEAFTLATENVAGTTKDFGYYEAADATGAHTIFAEYLPAPKENEYGVTFIVTVKYYGSDETYSRTFNDIPVRRNALTTLKGNFFTAGAEITVTVDENFDNSKATNISLWDGKTVTTPTTTKEVETENGQTVTATVVSSAAELAGLAAMVNAPSPSPVYGTRAGEPIYFVLTTDVDLNGHDWTPIGLTLGQAFKGTFDGQGHTIYGMKVERADVAGLFGYTYGATIKDVNIENAVVKSNHFAAGIVAWVNNSTGNINVPMVIENCHVYNSTISSTPELVDGSWDNGDKVGGIIGHAHFGDADYPANQGAKIKDCSVENTTIKAYRDFGGLVGYASHVAIENSTVRNITLEQDLSHDYKAPTPTTYGLFIGRDNGGNTINGKPYLHDGVAELNGNYYISNANGLKWVSENVNTMEFYVNKAANIFDGKTVYIENDIDLGGAEWRPIGDYAFSRTSFNGVFDGQGHTISNFKVTKPVRWTEKTTEASYGFFGNVKGTVKNLTIKNATVNPEGGRYSAVLVGRLHNGGRVENCHVVNSSATISHWQVGGLVGQNNNGNISDCSVTGSTITGKAAVGAIVGMDMAAGEHAINNCRVENTALVQNASFGADYDAMYGLAVGVVNESGITLNLNNVVADNNTIKGVASNKLIGDKVGGTKVYVNGYQMVSTAEELAAAIKAGGNYVLTNNIAMTEAIYQNVNFTLDGNGYTISQAEGSTNNNALFDSMTGEFTFKNVKFAGIKGGAVVRTIGATATFDNVTVEGAQTTQQQGLLRLCGANTIKNSTFKNNSCQMLITHNYDTTGAALKVENCVFENNTCNGTAVLYYVKGAGATINGNKFIGNTVNCNNNGATVYMGFTENNVVKNNLFQNNTVNEAGESSRVAGGIFFGYETVFTGNAFVGNKVTGENAKGKDVCVSTYYTNISLSGNYWGGKAPVEDDNYFVQHKTSGYEVIINNYLTENPIK